MNKILYIIFISCVCCVVPKAIYAAPSAIISCPASVSDTVDLGLSLVGDSLNTTFVLQNIGSESLKINGVDSSFYVCKPINYANDDHIEFSCAYPVLPYMLHADSTLLLRVKYFANPDLFSLPVGKKTVLLRLGLYDPGIVDKPTNLNLAAYHEYILIARKTDKYIDTYDKEIHFDSVYLKDQPMINKHIKIKNVSNFDLNLESVKIVNVGVNTVDGEFTVLSDNADSLSYKSGNLKSWSVYYSPQNRGWDTAMVVIKYKPEPINYPDSLMTLNVKLFGFGVEQKLDIFKTIDADFDGDTVSVGNVRANSTKKFTIVIRNSGNIPCASISQAVLKESIDENDPNFIIEKYAMNGKSNLAMDNLDTLIITFQPQAAASIIARYTLESDLNYRNIYGVPNKAVKKYIYLKAVGVEPDISLSNNLVDFGDVMVSGICPHTVDSTISIANVGNEVLHIYNVEFDPQPPIPFDVTPRECDIQPGEKAKFIISFNTDGLVIGKTYNVKVNFITNCSGNNTQVPVFLQANSITPESMNLSISRNLRVKPGNDISFPIIVEKSKITKANSFTAELYYDKYVLNYLTYNNISTASENSNSILIDDNKDEGYLSIKIQTGQGKFLQSDTLINLKFKSLLGDKISSPISFRNPMFGNDNCSNIFLFDNSGYGNGIITLDSVCGLELKTISLGNGQFSLDLPYPNPTDNRFKFDFSVAFKSNVKIKLFNSYGELVETFIDSDLPCGKYNFEVPTLNLAPGIYYCDMQAYLFRKTISIAVTK